MAKPLSVCYNGQKFATFRLDLGGLTQTNCPKPSDKDAKTTARHLLEGKTTSSTKPGKDKTSHWSTYSVYPSAI